MSNYREKLEDPRWQKKRLQILERDSWRCRLCGDGGAMLHVHHIVYKKGLYPWEHSENLLITLCKTCHGNEHYLLNVDSTFDETFKGVIEKGILISEIFSIFNIVSELVPTAYEFRKCLTAAEHILVERFIRKSVEKNGDAKENFGLGKEKKNDE